MSRTRAHRWSLRPGHLRTGRSANHRGLRSYHRAAGGRWDRCTARLRRGCTSRSPLAHRMRSRRRSSRRRRHHHRRHHRHHHRHHHHRRHRHHHHRRFHSKKSLVPTRSCPPWRRSCLPCSPLSHLHSCRLRYRQAGPERTRAGVKVGEGSSPRDASTCSNERKSFRGSSQHARMRPVLRTRGRRTTGAPFRFGTGDYGGVSGSRGRSPRSPGFADAEKRRRVTPRRATHRSRWPQGLDDPGSAMPRARNVVAERAHEDVEAVRTETRPGQSSLDRRTRPGISGRA